MQSPPSAPTALDSAPSTARPHRFWRACAVVLGIEVGLVLLTLPWTPLWERALWIAGTASSHAGFARVWLSPYLRGACSGLGLFNLWIATSEITDLRPHAN